MNNDVKLKNGTILSVGKKYVHATWTRDEVYEITAIGRDLFMYIPKGKDYELTHEIDNDWIPYEEEKKEKWYEVLFNLEAPALEYSSQMSKRYTNSDTLITAIYLREWDSKEEMINDLKKG